MWHDNTIYFLSDRGANKRNNLWAYDVGKNAARQVTQFSDFDITFPSIGPDSIVFQAGGRLYLLDLAIGKAVRGSRPRRHRSRRRCVRGRRRPSTLIQWASVSPTAKRAVFEARGDVFTVPAEFGAVVNVTRSSGVSERYPRWSPDGKTVAYWSDRTR